MLQAKERIAALLRANVGVAFCSACVSAVVSLDDGVTGSAIATLTQSWEFEQDYWLCFKCRKATMVFRAVPRQYWP